MRGFRSLLLATTVLPLGAADLIGLPPNTRPGPPPAVWALWGNDLFGGEIGHNADDFRTNQVSLGVRPSWYWASLEAGILTARDGDEDGTRIDELCLGVGALHQTDPCSWGWAWGTVGAGARYYGNLGGAEIQNFIHRLAQVSTVDIDYEHDEALEGFLAAGGHTALHIPTPWDREKLGSPLLFNRQVAVLTDVEGLIGTLGTMEGLAGSRLALMSGDAAFWLGGHWQWRSYHGGPVTRKAVGEAEDGFWFSLGASAGCFLAEIAWNPDTDLGMGRLGFQPCTRPSLGDQGRELFQADGGLVGQSLTMAMQARYQPTWLRELWAPVSKHFSLFGDFSYGRVPGDRRGGDDDAVRMLQGLMGLEYTPLGPPDRGWELAWSHLVLTPFLHAGSGCRRETLVDGSEQAATWVNQLGGGLRLIYDHAPNSYIDPRYGISVGYDCWFPWHEAELDGHPALQADSALTVRLLVELLW